MGYLLRRTDRGGYVAAPGSERSYTFRKDRARRYTTREAANADRCVDNEVVEEIALSDEAAA